MSIATTIFPMRFRATKSPENGRLFLILITWALALFSALAINFLPWQFVMLSAMAVCFVMFAVANPVWVMVPYLALSFYFPSLPVVDAVTVGLMFIMLVTATMNGTLKPAIRELPLRFFVLYAVVLLASIYGFVLRHNSLPFFYREGRVFLHLLWVLPLLAIVRGEQRLKTLTMLITFMAVAVSLVAIFQAVTGIVVVTTGRVADLDNISGGAVNTVRVQIPGFSFVMFALISSFTLLIQQPRFAWFLLPLIALFGIAIVFNYGRALWFWSVFGLLGTGLFFRLRGAAVLGLSAVIAIGGLGIGAALYKPELLNVITKRVESTFQEGGGNSSFGWRQQEMSAGLAKLTSTMGLGVGLGGEYRPSSFMLATWEDFSRYTHNSYLFLALKLGVAGLLVYLSVMVFILQQAWRAARSPKTKFYGATLFAFTLSFGGLCITQPELMEHAGVTLLAFCLALAAVMRHKPENVDPAAKAQRAYAVKAGI